MKENKIQSSFTNSAWIEKLDSSKHVSSVRPIEANETVSLVNALLQEFEQTESLDKVELEKKLTAWINSMPSIQISMDNQEKIRDFIYEMF